MVTPPGILLCGSLLASATVFFTDSDEDGKALEVGKYLVRIYRGGVRDHAARLCFSRRPGLAGGAGRRSGLQARFFSALSFGFAWGFGAICFGRSVDRLGVSIANSLVIGLSSALGSLVPLITDGCVARGHSAGGVILAASLAFLIGVWLCGRAGRLRDGTGNCRRDRSAGGLSFGNRRGRDVGGFQCRLHSGAAHCGCGRENGILPLFGNQLHMVADVGSGFGPQHRILSVPDDAQQECPTDGLSVRPLLGVERGHGVVVGWQHLPLRRCYAAPR